LPERRILFQNKGWALSLNTTDGRLEVVFGEHVDREEIEPLSLSLLATCGNWFS
jgi:hypothetical protein